MRVITFLCLMRSIHASVYLIVRRDERRGLSLILHQWQYLPSVKVSSQRLIEHLLCLSCWQRASCLFNKFLIISSKLLHSVPCSQFRRLILVPQCLTKMHHHSRLCRILTASQESTRKSAMRNRLFTSPITTLKHSLLSHPTSNLRSVKSHLLHTPQYAPLFMTK